MKYQLIVTVAALIALPANVARSAQLDSVADEIVGAWKLDFTTPDDVHRTPTVIIGRQHQELLAWYVEKDTPQAFKDVRLKDDTLLLTIRPKERSDVTVTFAAKLKDDGTCAGTGKFVSDDGDTGTWDFQGKRAQVSEFGDVTKWSLSFMTPDSQQREATVAVLSKDDKLYGWYSSKEYELPATKITMTGDKVVMSISAKTENGAKVDVTFQGTVTGDRVAGEAEYDLEGDTGSFPFTGKRKS